MVLFVIEKNVLRLLLFSYTLVKPSALWMPICVIFVYLFINLNTLLANAIEDSEDCFKLKTIVSTANIILVLNIGQL